MELSELLEKLHVIDICFGSPSQEDLQKSHLERFRLILCCLVEVLDILVFLLVCHLREVLIRNIFAIFLLEQSQDYICVITAFKLGQLLDGHVFAH